MTNGFLNVFISSKEKSELIDDRLVVQDVIRDICLNPVNSENRHSVSNPIELENIEEVMDSNIYIGILGKCFSTANKNEFDAARANGIKICFVA